MPGSEAFGCTCTLKQDTNCSGWKDRQKDMNIITFEQWIDLMEASHLQSAERQNLRTWKREEKRAWRTRTIVQMHESLRFIKSFRIEAFQERKTSCSNRENAIEHSYKDRGDGEEASQWNCQIRS